MKTKTENATGSGTLSIGHGGKELLSKFQKSKRRGTLTQVNASSRVTIPEVIEQWKSWRDATNTKPASTYTLFNRLARWVKKSKLSGRHPHEITSDMIDRLVNHPKGGKYANRVQELTAFRSFFSFCVARGYVAESPAVSVEVDKSKIPAEGFVSRTRQPISESDYKTLILFLEDELRDCQKRGLVKRIDKAVFYLAATHLARRHGFLMNEICQMTWDKLPKDTPYATLIPRRDDRFCFPDRKVLREEPKNRAVFSVEFKRLVNRSGLDDYVFTDLIEAWNQEQAKKSH